MESMILKIKWNIIKMINKLLYGLASTTVINIFLHYLSFKLSLLLSKERRSQNKFGICQGYAIQQSVVLFDMYELLN